MFALVSIALMTISIPSLLIAMEERDSSSYFSLVCHKLEPSEKKDAKNVYALADQTLASFSGHKIESAQQLISLIDATKTFFSTHNKDEHFLGSFAYRQKEPAFHDELLSNKTHPSRIAVFFYLLKKEYNTCISNKTTPTREEWCAYKNNQQKKLDYEHACSTVQLIGTTIDTSEINYNKAPFQTIANSVAITEFEKFSTIVENLCESKNADDLKILAEMIFVNMLGPIQTPQQ